MTIEAWLQVLCKAAAYRRGFVAAFQPNMLFSNSLVVFEIYRGCGEVLLTTTSDKGSYN